MSRIWRVAASLLKWLRWPALVGIVWLVWSAWPQRPVRTVQLPADIDEKSLTVTTSGIAVYRDGSKTKLFINDLPNNIVHSIPVPKDSKFGIANTPKAWLKVLTSDVLQLYSTSDGSKLLEIPIRGAHSSVTTILSDDRYDSYGSGRIVVPFNDELPGDLFEIWDVKAQKRLSKIKGVFHAGYMDPLGNVLTLCQFQRNILSSYDVETGKEKEKLSAPDGLEYRRSYRLDDGRIAVMWGRKNGQPGSIIALWDPHNPGRTIQWPTEMDDAHIFPETFQGQRLFLQNESGVRAFNIETPSLPPKFIPNTGLKIARSGYVLLGRRTLANLRIGPFGFDVIRPSNDTLIKKHDRQSQLDYFCGDYTVESVEPAWTKWLKSYPTILGQAYEWSVARAQWVVYDITTGKTLQQIPMGFEKGDNSFEVMIVEPWLLEFVRRGSNQTINIWPLIAPGPPWWLWLTTALGVLLIARDIRRTRRRSAGSVVVSSTM